MVGPAARCRRNGGRSGITGRSRAHSRAGAGHAGRFQAAFAGAELGTGPVAARRAAGGAARPRGRGASAPHGEAGDRPARSRPGASQIRREDAAVLRTPRERQIMMPELVLGEIILQGRAWLGWAVGLSALAAIALI